MPDAMATRDPFAFAHLAETVIEVQGDARMIFREYARLQRPDAVLFRDFNQLPHQSAADATSTRRRGDVDADFGHAGVRLALRHRAQSGPAENAVAVSDHQSALGQMAG